MSLDRVRVGFLCLSHIHQIYHIAPIAYELSRDPRVQVSLFSSHAKASQLLASIAGQYPGHDCAIVEVDESLLRRFSYLHKHPFPRPRNVLRNNLKRLMGLDAVVSSDYYTSYLIERRKGDSPKFILTFHGAGDRDYGFRPAVRDYDFLLVYGNKFRRRLEEVGALRDGHWAMMGYPKFDLTAGLWRDDKPLFNNDNPVVLYNPHFQPNYSSWPSWGRQVLEFFVDNPDYNLIFAPHIMMFSKKGSHVTIGSEFQHAPNILIDVDSAALINMRYTNAADIYIGDVSSQVYEFIVKPRPCLFLNAHHVNWRSNPNYRHWHMGPVLESMSEFAPRLANAHIDHAGYHDTQVEFFEEEFAISDTPATVRAAQAIAGFLIPEGR